MREVSARSGKIQIGTGVGRREHRVAQVTGAQDSGGEVRGRYATHRVGHDRCGRLTRQLELQAHRAAGEDSAVQCGQRRIGVPVLEHPLAEGGHDP
jgi:hypothetical protein